METQTSSLFDRFNNWIQESIMIKLLSIGFLILILLIPNAWIEELIHEREGRAKEVKADISDKWSKRQTVLSPMLIVPFKQYDRIKNNTGEIEVIETTLRAVFLPETFDLKGDLKPEALKRGIFESVVYRSNLQIQSQFKSPDFAALNIEEKDILWNEAVIWMSLSDLRGISENPIFKVGDKELTADASSVIGERIAEGQPQGIFVKPGWQTREEFQGLVSIQLNLKGSEYFGFIPSGKTTSIALTGSWNTPSFTGSFLPEQRDVTEKDFKARWNVLHFNRPFAAQWVEGSQHVSGSEFGVNLLIPVDHYQKSIRTSKYSVLIILLTFIALFMVEITRKVRIHPFQYILIGAALCVFYTLLLSLSEHVDYNLSYVIAALLTIVLLTLYSFSFFPVKSLSWLLSGFLTLFYTFVFVIILEQDYSLLIGSIGLFLIIAALMYFSRGVRWYGRSEKTLVQ